MTHTTTARAVRRGLPTAAALLAALAVAPAPARAAADPIPASGPGTWLHLTVTRGDALSPGLGWLRPGGAPSGTTRAVLLLCDPPRGHARAGEACAQLDALGGGIRRVAPEGAACAMIYAPVTAQARGQWRGRPVDYRETFSNTCQLEAVTGAVFALDS
ncbi:subtilase-type protease inhibitor [Streptomyces sp. enrichment culture]|uniref:SSI family serine proteinase inhibitor n=1 Tax=Streptomyces sp. enrichment culture TaxID=1795815 RepID=UPI003F56075D